MATYAGITFNELATDRMWRPYWEREANVTVRNIPYGNKDDVQSAGMGNPKLTLQVMLTADADMDTLLAAAGPTGLTLTNLFVSGNDYNNVRLIECSSMRRHDASATWTAQLTFMREGS